MWISPQEKGIHASTQLSSHKHIYGINNISPTFIFQGTRHARTPSPAGLLVWTGCVSPSNPHVGALTPNVKVLGGGASGRSLGLDEVPHWSWATHMPCGMAKRNLKKEASRYKDVLGKGGKETRGQFGTLRTEDTGYFWGILGLSLQSHLDGRRNPS